MHLDFAKTKSDAIVKQSGDEAELEAHKRKRVAEKERKQAATEAERIQKEKLKRPPPEAEAEGKSKTAKLGGGLKSTAKTSVVPDEYLPPNKILFLQNVHEVGAIGAKEGTTNMALADGKVMKVTFQRK